MVDVIYTFEANAHETNMLTVQMAFVAAKVSLDYASPCMAVGRSYEHYLV